ncbi:hypothetical protein BDN70DRAFT_880920 [Pholiota conissans]|uniref:Uncharacterized protein n=1 Tax=Pholiota conissans TaxID=109636 RepID=A0A9P5Z1B7_9AGAR|nr:hypothetical protein BDN70DRAFT_880920 [Pholiota conissans]
MGQKKIIDISLFINVIQLLNVSLLLVSVALTALLRYSSCRLVIIGFNDNRRIAFASTWRWDLLFLGTSSFGQVDRDRVEQRR